MKVLEPLRLVITKVGGAINSSPGVSAGACLYPSVSFVFLLSSLLMLLILKDELFSKLVMLELDHVALFNT